jgi:hypothetical protein
MTSRHKLLPWDVQSIAAITAVCATAWFFFGIALIKTVLAEDTNAVAEPAVDAAVDQTNEKFIITGRVTNDAGAGIADATVEWGRNDTRFGRRKRTRTKPDGTYAFALQSIKGEHRLAASAPGYSAQTADAQLVRGKQERNFVLKRSPKKGHAVAGNVVDQHNKPIAGASVEAFTPVVGFFSSFSTPTGRDYFPGPDRVDTTDEQGRFRIIDLPTEQVQLNITSKHRYVGDTNYPVEEGLIIVMSGSGEPGVIQCRVVDAATKLPPKTVADVRIVPRYETTNYKCAPETGTFRLPRELTLGDSYMMYVYAKDYAIASAKLKSVPADSTEFTDIELRPKPALRGKLIDAETGKPIAAAPIVYGIADHMSYIEWSSLPKYADGYHSLEFVQHEVSTATGEFWFAEPESGSRGLIIVFVDGYQRLMLYPRDRRFDEGSGQLIIKLKRESAIEGVVRINGKLAPNTSVSVSGSDAIGMSNMYESVRTDANGKFRYGRLGPGNYRVHGGPYSRVAKLEKGQTFTVNLGEDLGPIRVYGDAEPDVSISLSPLFRWDYTHFETKADEKGKYEIAGLKVGRYSVYLSSNSHGYFSHRETEMVVKADGEKIDLLPKASTKSAKPVAKKENEKQ